MSELAPFPEANIAPEIAAQVDNVAAAKAALTSLLETIQANCAHRIVSEAPYASPGMAARRICNHCRIEEEGSHWSGGSVWSRANHEPAVLGNEPNRLIMPVSRDELFGMRVRP